MKWVSIKEGGIPDFCGEYLVHHIYEGWPMITTAWIEDETFFDETGGFLDVTHWAKLEYPKISDDIPN